MPKRIYLSYYVAHAKLANPYALTNPKKFKLLFLDTGLVQRSTRMDALSLLQGDILSAHKGMIAEHYVGQELLAYQDPLMSPEIYYWERDTRGSNAELDYVINIGIHIVPIEVKSDSSGKLKSLKLFMEHFKSHIGIHVATHMLDIKNNIITLPLYLISELERLIKNN